MFATTMEKGTCLAPSDVCKTPNPGGPVPTPYPNIGQCAAAQGSSCTKKVFIVGMKAHTIKTKIPQSQGDQGGSAGGVASNKIMGEVQYSKGSQKVYLEGPPAVTFGASTLQNASPPNTTGNLIAPSQNKVIIPS